MPSIHILRLGIAMLLPWGLAACDRGVPDGGDGPLVAMSEAIARAEASIAGAVAVQADLQDERGGAGPTYEIELVADGTLIALSVAARSGMIGDRTHPRNGLQAALRDAAVLGGAPVALADAVAAAEGAIQGDAVGAALWDGSLVEVVVGAPGHVVVVRVGLDDGRVSPP